MKKRFPWIWVILVLLVVIGLCIWWFWSLGSIRPVEVGSWKLEVRSGQVTVVRDGKDVPATNNMEIKEGDSIKTGSDGQAILEADGRAQIVIDKNSTFQVEGLNKGSILDFGLRSKLQNGRIWPRLLKLMDLDSAFVTRTDQVVSTVRGTSYSFETDGNLTKLWMEHGGVISKPKTGKSISNAAGQWATFDAVRSESGQAASSTWKDQAWLDANRPQDIQFITDADALLTKALIAGGKSAPDAWNYGIAQWSENLHLSFAGAKAPALYGQYSARRLGYIKDLIDRGKSGLAFYHLNNFENDLNQKLENPDSKAYRPGLQQALAMLMLSQSDVQPGTLMFRLKLKAEDLYAKTWENDPTAYLYAKLLSVDSRLDEVESLLCKPESKAAYDEAFNAVDQGLKRNAEDWSKLASKEGRSLVIKEKMDMQTARFEQAKKLAAQCVAPPAPTNPLDNTSPTSTSDVLTPTSTLRTPTSTKPTAPTTPTNPPVTSNPPLVIPPSIKVIDLALVRIELYAQPNPANVGDAVKMYVKGFKADGSVVDATSYAKFSQIGSLGTFSGATFTASKAGSSTLIANVVSGTQTLTARTNLQINAGPVAISRLEVTVASGGLSVILGQTRTVKATVYYTNGFTSDVTRSVAWSMSNGLGSISGITFTANARQTGSVTAFATYTENGVTKEGQITFNIIASPTGAVN
ncbi:MAG: hypothetical protein WCW31_01840 [Patescibacteria group bacterium]